MKTKLLFLFLLASAFSFQSKATIWTVNVTDFAFTPSSLPNVVTGDTIKWVWMGAVNHTTTSTAVPAGAATWNSPLDASNTTFMYKVTHAGHYTYHCNIHASMIGSFDAVFPTSVPSFAQQAMVVSVSPNPAVNELNVSGAGITEIRLMDITGKLLLQSHTQGTLDISAMSSGIYVLQVKAGDAIEVKKIQVQK